MANCPKGHGQLRRDSDDDLVCVTCGYRDIEVASNGYGSSQGDPFAALVKHMREALAELRSDLASTESRIAQRKQQVKRLERAVAVLTDGAPAKVATPTATRKAPLCSACGSHPASIAHRNQCKAPVAS